MGAPQAKLVGCFRLFSRHVTLRLGLKAEGRGISFSIQTGNRFDGEEHTLNNVRGVYGDEGLGMEQNLQMLWEF